MIAVITFDKDLNEFEIERLGQIYQIQAESGLVVLPKGATIENLPSLIGITVEPQSWREKIFG